MTKTDRYEKNKKCLFNDCDITKSFIGEKNITNVNYSIFYANRILWSRQNNKCASLN